jgi:hypothetical protein
MRHSIFQHAAALGLAGVFALALHSVVNAQPYDYGYDSYGYGYSYGYRYYGPGTSYEGPSRERMVKSTGN